MMSMQRYTLVILSQRPMHKRIFQLLLFSLIVILVGGVVALLLQTQPSSHASGGSVVGPPTLPASTVDAIFARLGSPMVGTGKVVVQASQKAKVDDAFALAVWWVETNDGAAAWGARTTTPEVYAAAWAIPRPLMATPSTHPILMRLFTGLG